MPTKPSNYARSDKSGSVPGPAKQRRVVTVVSRSGRHGRELTTAANLERVGNFDAAISIYRKILRISPNDVDALLYLGRCLSLADRPRKAVVPLEAALARRPADPKVLLLLGEARRDLGGAGAAECFEQVLRQQPDNHLALARLGQVLVEIGRTADGIAKLRAAVTAEPDNGLFILLLANALVADRRFGEAEKCFRTLMGMKGRLDGHLGMARLAETLGRLDEAVGYLEEAHRRAPNHPEVVSQHIKHRKADSSPGLLAAAGELAASPDLPGRQRAQLHFMLGQAADAAGDSDRAFEHLATGNALRRRNLADTGQFYDKDIIAGWFDDLIARFDANFFARHARRGGDSELPVFVVGMPRSGTTLTEQILSGHSRIHGAGELGQLERIAASLAPSGRKGDMLATELSDEQIAESSAKYLHYLRTLSPTADRIVDKNPSNFTFLGLIAILFPRARVIHCRRDPRDVALSCYMQNFRAGKPWSYDLDQAAHYYRQYHRLMTHWRAVLPISILELPYESIVEDLECWARRLIDFCGLDWEDGVLDFHRVERPVFTASQRQVRQPIYKAARGKWRKYERHLAPFISSVGDLLD